MKNQKDKNNNDVELKVRLIGKSSNSIIISLDDLTNIANGINGLSKYVIKKMIGKDIKSKFDKDICTLGITTIEKGSAVLKMEAFSNEQRVLCPVNLTDVMKEIVNYIDELENDESKIPIEIVPYFDNLTKPLDNAEANIEVSVYEGENLIVESKKLNIQSRKKIQSIKERKKLVGGIMYGTLKEVNLKDYSARIELFNKKLEKFIFNEEVWQTIRDLLETKVEVKFEGKGYNKQMVEIKKISNFQDKRKMTGKDLLESGVVGLLKGRDELNNSVEYAKKLADEFFK